MTDPLTERSPLGAWPETSTLRCVIREEVVSSLSDHPAPQQLKQPRPHTLGLLLFVVFKTADRSSQNASGIFLRQLKCKRFPGALGVLRLLPSRISQ